MKELGYPSSSFDTVSRAGLSLTTISRVCCPTLWTSLLQLEWDCQFHQNQMLENAFRQLNHLPLLYIFLTRWSYLMDDWWCQFLVYHQCRLRKCLVNPSTPVARHHDDYRLSPPSPQLAKAHSIRYRSSTAIPASEILSSRVYHHDQAETLPNKGQNWQNPSLQHPSYGTEDYNITLSTSSVNPFPSRLWRSSCATSVTLLHFERQHIPTSCTARDT